MPLTDLIRYFNVADNAGESTLYPDGKRAAAWHRGLRLGSLFQPIVDLQREQTGGYLQLAVHPRHLLALQNQHGLVYEAILKRCGLAPEDIVLHIDAGSVGRHGKDGVAYNHSSSFGGFP